MDGQGYFEFARVDVVARYSNPHWLDVAIKGGLRESTRLTVRLENEATTLGFCWATLLSLRRTAAEGSDSNWY
jgi:hypothetical protein